MDPYKIGDNAEHHYRKMHTCEKCIDNGAYCGCKIYGCSYHDSKEYKTGIHQGKEYSDCPDHGKSCKIMKINKENHNMYINGIRCSYCQDHDHNCMILSNF